MKSTCIGVAALLAAAGAAIAQPQIDMKYTVTDIGGGQFAYNFTLAPNANWAAGMGWRWLIFGDEPCTGCTPPGTGTSPLTNFVMTSAFPVGPWTGLSSSGGGHNGPTFSGVLDYWIPATGTEALTWSGQSDANLQQGQMRWSTLAGTLGGATAADWTVAECTNCGATCYADCNGDTVLNLSDFGCFTTKFALGDPYADCNGDSVLNLADFGCFTTKFALGCP
ncbi:MAG: hypothetical protein IT437_11820 [Phycisphaerales bacterium]|nr:hypothetical protein [Phycisphaerales bacterium]